MTPASGPPGGAKGDPGDWVPVLEGRPHLIADGDWGTWVAGDPAAIEVGAVVLQVTADGRAWEAPIVDVLGERHSETGETLCRLGPGSKRVQPTEAQLVRRHRRAHDAQAAIRRAKAEAEADAEAKAVAKADADRAAARSGCIWALGMVLAWSLAMGMCLG